MFVVSGVYLLYDNFLPQKTALITPTRNRKMNTQWSAVLHQAQVGGVAAVMELLSVCVLLCRKMWRQS